MCGRTRCTLRPDDVPKASHRHTVPTRFLHLDRYHPSYNVAPGSYMPILRRDNEVVGDGVVVHCMKWGLVPSFTKKTEKPDFFKMFNARSESVAEKASFRRLLPKNRCLVAVDGFYEWKKEGSKKQPYYIHFEDGRPLVFAALFDTWQNSGGETLYTFTILTTTSSSALHWLHDTSVITSLLHKKLELLKVLDSEKNKERLFMQCIVDKWTNPKTLVMPVILGDKDSIDTWLDDPSTTKLQPLLSPYEKSDLVWYPVTPAIGKPTFDGPECIQQIPLKASQNSLISKFFSAKQPKADEGDKETKSTDANITVDLKEEPTVEGHEGAIFSDSIKKIEELDEEKDISNEAKNLEFQKTVKSEPFVEDNSAVVSHLEPVKNEVEDGTYGEGKSIETGLTKERGESNATIPAESYNLDLPRISKEEPDTQGHHRINTIEESNQLEVQHEAVQDKPGNENQKTVLTSQTAKEGGLEFSEKSSEKSGTKRDYEVFSSQEKPRKHFERLQDVKSSGKHGRKQGKGKSNIKKSKETQSTLHFFFDEK